MSRECFRILCERLCSLEKRDTTFMKCIPLETSKKAGIKRVAIALYTLRSSAEYATIGRLFGVSKATVCVIFIEFCVKVWEVLSSDYLHCNIATENKIDGNVKGFEAMGFPQCFGALDGCHIEVKPPKNEAFDHYNYKGWYSMVLLALVDYR
ncbi:uncharacterized protein LOC131803215 [Musca domestica]|uniref:Uncharacterized protein LOC131803215 n=1 Tax=Musca domestica TaxID=7370 RepID=A0ABM3V3E5_MUSDO|nr:uncharacterized protein LOC131803215 [Musca domestica]